MEPQVYLAPFVRSFLSLFVLHHACSTPIVALILFTGSMLILEVLLNDLNLSKYKCIYTQETFRCMSYFVT